ncbi:MAG: cytochrome c3 family protein [Dehalococcoidia bacterium]
MKEAVIFFAILILVVAGGAFMISRASAAAVVEQPIAFSHAKHGKFLECASCHQTVETRAAAGIPQAELCMTCHRSPVTENPEADKIKEYSQRGEEIPWTRLFDVSDDIIFSHRRHLSQEVECASCHGDVGSSPQARGGFGRKGKNGLYGYRLMDSCTTCHQEKQASNDCLSCHN